MIIETQKGGCHPHAVDSREYMIFWVSNTSIILNNYNGRRDVLVFINEVLYTNRPTE